MNKEDICYMSACEMRDSILRQDLSSQEITEAIIERIEKINPLINAYCTTTFDLARDLAKEADRVVKNGERMGLLHGIPVSIKDEMDTKGIRTTYGSKFYENQIPEVDDVAVERLRKAGCVILGKTNMPEFGHHPGITDNLIFGFTNNPWDLKRTSGGSSGGSAAAVASGMGPLSLGADGGGSIRVPSSICGVYGLKPTFGRIPRYPSKGIFFWNMDHYGPISRYVNDAALMLNVMKGHHPYDQYSFPDDGFDYLKCLESKPEELKIGYSMDLGFFKSLDETVEKVVREQVDKFTQYGWDVENTKLKLRKPEYSFNVFASLGYAFDSKKFFNERPEDLSPDLKGIIRAGLSFKGQDVAKAIAQRKGIYEVFNKYFKEFDILITPTTPCPAFITKKSEYGTIFPSIKGRGLSITSWMSFTYPFNLTGLPAASIPCGRTDSGLPIGMQIIGKRFDEKTVLQVSKAFEEVAPWQNFRPEIR
jgi:aspartyl-tRNA(Asn)/glutamyl-tRNA(Gln) amidotransferase subunit A